MMNDIFFLISCAKIANPPNFVLAEVQNMYYTPCLIIYLI